MSHLQTLPDTHSVISSQALASGHSPYVERDGQMTFLYGPAVVRASLSARQALKLGLMTRATSGQVLPGSSKSAALQSPLESRLQVKLSSLGSTLYKLTWKQWATPSGVCRFRLRASVPRTSETVRTGWQTPVAHEARLGYQRRRGDTKGSQVSLTTEVVNFLAPESDPMLKGWNLSAWPTPNATNNGAGEEPGAKAARGMNPGLNPADAARLAGWPTTRATDGTNNARSLQGAENEALRKSWNNDLGVASFSVVTNNPARLTASGELLTGCSAEMPSGGQLNPAHSRWLQALPVVWDEAAPIGIPPPDKKAKATAPAG